MQNKKNIKLKLALLTAILALTLLAPNVLLVNADAGGTGKFLTIDFEGPSDLFDSDCSVTATKVSSEQVFTFLATNDGEEENTQRMAAGTILLEAKPADGWIFLGFTSEGELTPNPDDLSGYTEYFKNEKGGLVIAEFAKEEYRIFTSYTADGGFITDDDPEGTIVYEYLDTPTFTFTAYEGFHLSSVIIDAEYPDQKYYASFATTYDSDNGVFTSSYTFPPLTSSHTIHAIFSLDGESPVGTGENVAVFLSSRVSLTFEIVDVAGIAYGYSIVPALDDLIVWSIEVDDILSFVNGVEVAFQFEPGFKPLEILVCHDPDVELFYRSDFDGDGQVTGQDVSIISNLIKHEKFLPDDVPTYDLSGDGILDENDVHVVNSFNGMDYSDFTWESLSVTYDDLYNIIYGITEGFSLFRCR